MLKEWFSVREILKMQITGYTNENRLNNDLLGCYSRPYKTTKKDGKEYHIASLPTKLKKQVIEHELKKVALKKEQLNGTNTTKELLTTYAKLDLITSFRNSKLKLKEFCNKYNAKALQNINHDNYLYIQKLTQRTTYRWVKAYEKEGMEGLKPKTALRKLNKSKYNTSTMSFKDLAIGMLLQKPHLKSKVIYKFLASLAKKQELQIPSYRIVCKYLKDYKTQNKQEYLYIKNPDAWKSKYALALGNASENITEPNELWELDSSPADVLIEGGRYTLVACIDVYSRRAKILVSKTSNSKAITSLLRACILEWGLPSAIKTDNGKDYKSKQISLFLNEFNIKQILAQPFAGEQKPHVERFFGRIQGDILTAHPSYIGANVAQRKAIEAVKTFEKRIFGNEKQANITAQELQNFVDYWIAEHYLNKPHQGINNQTPQSRLEGFKPKFIAEHKLYMLDLLLEELKGLRTVGKKGIRVENANYFGYELASYVGKEVLVRVDRFDMGVIYVFDKAHNFICKAQNLALLGKSKQEFVKKSKALQTSVLKTTKTNTKRLINKSKTLNNTELLEYASKNNVLEEAILQAEKVQEETYLYEQVIHEKSTTKDEGEQRYQKAKVLQKKLNNNQVISKDDKAWLESYLSTPEYLSKRDREKALLEMFGQI